MGLASGAEEQGAHRTMLSVVFLGGDALPSQLAWVKIDGSLEKDKPIKVSGSSILPAASYSGPPKLTLCDLADEDVGRPLVKITLPSYRWTLVVVAPSSSSREKGLPYRAFCIDLSQTRMPAGAREVYNFTPYPIRCAIGKIPFRLSDKTNRYYQISSRQSKVIEDFGSLVEPRKGLQVYIEFRQPDGETWTRFKSSRWFHNTTKRKFLFVYCPKGDSTPQLKIISQLVAPESESK